MARATTETQNKIAGNEYRAIDSLVLWDKNPRGIKTDRFQELKQRIARQGQLKPLLITQDGIVIGGNMRLRAMRELGIDTVWVAVTEAQTDQEIFDIAMTDNEEFGYYEHERLAELAMSIGINPLDLDKYEVHIDPPKPLSVAIGTLSPTEGVDDAPREETCRNCPFHCGGES